MSSGELSTALLLSVCLFCFSLFWLAEYALLSHRLSGVATTLVSFIMVALPVFLLTGIALPDNANLVPLRVIISSIAGMIGVGKLWRWIKAFRRNPQIAQWPYTTRDEVSSRAWHLVNAVSGFVLGAVIGASIMHMAHPQSNYLAWGAVFGAEMAVVNAGLLNLLVRRLSRR